MRVTYLDWMTQQVLYHGINNPDCMVWPHRKNDDGYGEVGVNNQKRRVHQVAYECIKGKVPIGMELDHLCRNRACFNPSHLEAVPHKENMARSPRQGFNREKTHCLRGHEFNKQNTRISKAGRRHCRRCLADYMRVYRLKKEGGESDS